MTSEVARAKVNLALHITGVDGRGYHLLDSLVVFPNIGDRLFVETAPHSHLTLSGPFHKGLSSDDNLILKAAQFYEGGFAFHLEKNLPVASGIGGGSSDAAATLRALSRLSGQSLPHLEDQLLLGADVPVCIENRSMRMRGIGEHLDPITLPKFYTVLVNPGVAVSTKEIFQNLGSKYNSEMDPLSAESFEGLVTWLKRQRNDLQDTAIKLAPVITEVLDCLSKIEGATFSRMSGSGATCFALFPDQAYAEAAAHLIRTIHPEWWVAFGEV